MHAFMRYISAVFVAATAVGVAPTAVPTATSPASAAPSNCGCVTIQCVIAQSAGLWGGLECIRDQYDDLTRYDREPETCIAQNRADVTGQVLSYTGTVQWVLIAEGSQDGARERLGAESGLAYNRVCVPDEEFAATGVDIAPALYETRVFDAITPENLALLAMDEFFMGLPAPDPTLNPEPVSLVNVDTWLGVGNIPAGVQTSPTISVPGPTNGRIEVYAIAEANEVEWDMGDGSEPFTCPLREPVHPPVCNTYRFQRSTAGEPNLTYYGTASIIWSGRFFVNGVLQPEELSVPQASGFEIQVAEAQAINIDPD